MGNKLSYIWETTMECSGQSDRPEGLWGKATSQKEARSQGVNVEARECVCRKLALAGCELMTLPAAQVIPKPMSWLLILQEDSLPVMAKTITRSCWGEMPDDGSLLFYQVSNKISHYCTRPSFTTVQLLYFYLLYKFWIFLFPLFSLQHNFSQVRGCTLFQGLRLY